MRDRHIRVGTSGWSYPSGQGTWTGLFYPPPGRGNRPPGFDELSYYAEHFDTVEVNSSFYRVPGPRTTQRWVDRTPPDFEFSVKLHQKFTHPKMFMAATGTDSAAVSSADVDAMKRALDPLRHAGKLGVLLAQFPPSFKKDASNDDYVRWLLQAFADTPVGVELRHRTWSDDVGSTLSLLRAYGAAWVQIDEPKFRLSIAQNQLPNVTELYYMRLHGRNARNWWTHDTPEDRYDYLYSANELKPIADTADAAGRLVRKVYLYLNNHFAAKAVANAIELKHLLGLPNDGVYPDAFTARYPSVAHMIRSGGSHPTTRAEASLLLSPPVRARTVTHAGGRD